MTRQYKFRIEEKNGQYRVQRRFVYGWFSNIFGRNWEYVLDKDFSEWVTDNFDTAEFKLKALTEADKLYCKKHCNKPKYYYLQKGHYEDYANEKFIVW